jgi:uncharacterized protein YjeT (DUF2065 family)
VKHPASAGPAAAEFHGIKNMSDNQIFQVIGLIVFTMGLGMLINPEYFRKILRDFSYSPSVTFLTGIFAIMIGYLIITFHDIWYGTSAIITVFGWLAMLKGLGLILSPMSLFEISKGIVRKKENFTLASIFCLSLGIIFLYLGYLA